MLKNQNTTGDKHYRNKANTLDFAIEILKNHATVPNDERIAEFNNLKYYQYPEEPSGAVMD